MRPFTLRLSDAASAHLAQRAAERGVSASAYVRALVEADRQGRAIEAPAPIADRAVSTTAPRRSPAVARAAGLSRAGVRGIAGPPSAAGPRGRSRQG